MRSARSRSAALSRFADGVANPLLRIGDLTRNTFQNTGYAPQFKTIERNQLEWAYQGSWICSLAVDIIAEDMTREGVDIFCDSAELPDEINRQFDDLRVWDSVCDAIKWSRLYGGAIAVMLIDGDDVSKPLGLIQKGAFKGIAVFDRWQLDQTQGEVVQELGPAFGKPQYYRVLAGSSEISFSGPIHHSRVIRFEGRRLPYNLRQAYCGWGASVLEPLLSLVSAFDLATSGVSQLLSKAYLRYYKVEGLRDILTNAQAREGFLKQMDIMREFQGIEGLTIGDITDDFQTLSYTFTGIPEILLQIGQQISGAIGVPLVRLFGQSPVGFNSTGESDLRTYYDNVKHDQDSELRPGLKRIMSAMYQSATGKAPGKDFTFEFKSLWQMTNEQKAAAAQSMTASIISALQADAITPAIALRELRSLSDTVGIFASISDEDIETANEMDNGMMPPDPKGAVNGNEQGVPGAGEDPAARGVVQEAPPEGSPAGGADRKALQAGDRPD